MGRLRGLERTVQLIRKGHDPHTALRIANCEAAGIEICDSLDHNDGCTNPDCPVWGKNAGPIIPDGVWPPLPAGYTLSETIEENSTPTNYV